MYGQGSQPQSPLTGALNWLAMVAAFMAMLLCAPYLNGATQGFVIDIASGSYPREVVRVIGFLWMCACFPLCFFSVHAFLNVLLTIGIMKAGSRGRR